MRPEIYKRWTASCSSTGQDEGLADGSHRRSEFAAVLPWYEDRPEAGGPYRARLQLNYGKRKKAAYVYLTATLDAATWGLSWPSAKDPAESTWWSRPARLQMTPI